MPVPVLSIGVPIRNATDSVPVGSGAVDIGDIASYPQSLALPSEGQGFRQPEDPAYTGPEQRLIIEQSGALPPYSFLAPVPGSTDLVTPRDIGGIAGVVYENIMNGPVSGYGMDVDGYAVGHRQILMTTPPGQIGPVIGGQDYGTMVSNAQFQEAFAVYSNAPSAQAIVSAI